MRLMTLNIRFGAGSEALDRHGYDLPASSEKLAAIAGAIQSVQPDAVALQEVRNAKQAEKIAGRLKMSFVYTAHPSSYAFDFFEWGLAFVYRHKLMRRANRVIYFDAAVRFGKQALLVTMVVEDRPITLMNLHLDSRAIGGQLENVLAWAQEVDTPLVLMGDFNCLPDDPVLAPLRTQWRDSCRAVASSGAREAGVVGTLIRETARIDHIFVDPRSFSVDDVGLVPPGHRRVSDHIGYFADVRLIERFRSAGAPEP